MKLHQPLRTMGIFGVLLILLPALYFGLNKSPSEQALKESINFSRPIVDMAGRQVTVPAHIRKVYCTSALGTIMVYTLAPEKLAGWNTALSKEAKQYILPQYADLPVLGGLLSQKNDGSVEEVIKANPDLIISMGHMNGADKDAADKIARKTNIPVVLVDGQIANTDKAYIFVGKLLNQEERAESLAAYSRDTLAQINQERRQITNPKRVYYAEGPKGLVTEPKGSLHSEILDLAGAVNVAGTDILLGGNAGYVPVSLEQVLAWDADVVIAGYTPQGANSYTHILSNKDWQTLKAVKNRQVFEIPNYPFNWIDRPPSVNRLIGVKWLANLLYPETYPMDIKAEVKWFYHLFYHYQLTDQQVDSLLKNAIK